MKGYLTYVLVFLAFCMAIFLTGCAEDSAWGASYGGADIQPGEKPATYSGGTPPGSGSVPYVNDNRL
jgi:hypothetical protein